MGLNKRDKQDKLKSQSFLDSERSSHDGGGSGGSSSTTRTVVVDHGTIVVPVETVVSTVSSSSKQSKSSSKSSSSKQQQILHSSIHDAGSIAESVHLSTEKSFGALDDGSVASVAGSSKLAEQKFSTVSSVRSAAQKSKQIDNIIEKIHHIASDTISTTEQITTAAPSTATSFTHGTKDVTQKKTVVTSDGSGARQGGSVSGGDTVSQQEVITTVVPSKIEFTTVAFEGSAHNSSNVSSSHTSNIVSSSSSSSAKATSNSNTSAINQKEQTRSHGAVRSEKIMSESSATQQQHSESRSSKSEQSSSTMQSSSSTMQSSSSSKSHKEAHSKSLVSGETAHSSLRSQKHLIDGTDLQNGGTVLGVSSLITTAPDHSTYDQQSFHTIDADGSRKQVDSESYSMAKSQAPTTKILYDAAGNQITSTSASYQSAQGHSTSSFKTSGTHDHNATDSKLHQASTSSAISSSHRDERVSTSSSTAVNSSTSSSDKRFSVIDSTTLENYSTKAEQDSSSAQHSSMLMKNASAHTVASLSSAHDSLDSTIQSTQLMTESSQMADQRHQHSESSKTIESASHYEQMDERSSSRRKTSEFREQRESNAAILKRKIYDENGRRLNLIDEKIVPKDIVTADLQDDVTNVTKTSFEAKLFNPTLKRWELVDQKTILEKDITTEIPVEIVKELEVERPELANITTTIQLTKVYDAKTKQWKTVDQKKHIDVVEKITYLEENSGRSELNESEHSKNLRSIDMVDRVTIKEVQDLSEEKRQQLNKSKKRVDEKTIQEQCICEICTCGRHNCFNCGGGTTSTQTKSSKYISSSNSENFYHQENFTSELNEETSTIRRGTWTKEDAEQHQTNRRESYTIEHSSTENDVSGRRLTWTKDDFEAADISKIKGERPKPIRHEDNLKPEGQFYAPERPGYTPGERVQPIKHDDNLRPEGAFSAPEKPEYRSGERPKPVRPQDNLKPEGEFERPQKPSVGKPERSQPVRHDDNLRPEGDFERPEKSPFRPAERPKQVRPGDNLRPEGEFDRPEKSPFKPAERPKQIKPEDNLRPEGDFQTPERPEYRSGERPKPIRPDDNLRPEGDFERPEKSSFRPAERPKQTC